MKAEGRRQKAEGRRQKAEVFEGLEPLSLHPPLRGDLSPGRGRAGAAGPGEGKFQPAFCPEYSLKIPRLTVRCTSLKPARSIADRIESGGTQSRVVAQ